MGIKKPLSQRTVDPVKPRPRPRPQVGAQTGPEPEPGVGWRNQPTFEQGVSSVQREIGRGRITREEGLAQIQELQFLHGRHADSSSIADARNPGVGPIPNEGQLPSVRGLIDSILMPQAGLKQSSTVHVPLAPPRPTPTGLGPKKNINVLPQDVTALTPAIKRRLGLNFS